MHVFDFFGFIAHKARKPKKGDKHMRKDVIQRFFGIPDHCVNAIYFFDVEGKETTQDEEVDHVVIDVVPTNRDYCCSCGRRFRHYYDYRERFVRDLPWGPWPRVELLVPRFRVNCPDCGVKTEVLSWIAQGCTYTTRLREAVALACREVRCISAIAEAFNLGWDTVKAIDKQALDKELNPPDFSEVRHLAIDEFSIRRRHTYGTTFLDVERNRVLWVCETRTKEAVVDVFKNIFGEAVCAQIQAVSMDWWEAYEKAVEECLPNAEIIWDLFHIVKKYNKEVVDRVRLDEARRCQTEEEQQTMKKSKYILLKNRRNLTEDEPARLKELLAVNRRLSSVYILRDALKQTWDYIYKGCAEKWFNGWYQWAIRSRIEPLKKFARSLKKRLSGILAHCRYPISTGVLEGINNKIKVIKRIAYGFRDIPYFFLKIRAHFGGG